MIDPSIISCLDADWAARFPRRIRAPEKEAFLQMLDQALQERGFATERLTLRSMLTNRLLVTCCEKPEVIVMAHYDTPTTMPVWIPPLYTIFGHTRQITMSVALIFMILLPNLLVSAIAPRFPSPAWGVALTLVYALLVLSLFPMLIPNPHNREDNTSGVIGLLALADWIKDQPALKDKVQFAFLDNEEWGLLGSGALKEHWDKQGHPYREAVVISLDCISRGRVPLVIHHGEDKHALQALVHLQKYLPEARLMNMHFIPLSDNYTFRRQGAIDITFTDRALVPGGYYVPRIHVHQDDDLSPQRLAACVQGLGEFLSALQANVQNP
jgi:Peptidase family M28